MYSRKYIRPTLPERAAPAGIPTPPPDYAGIAFRPTDERTIQDYPETAIPAASLSNSRSNEDSLNSAIQMSHFVDRADAQPSIPDADEEIGSELSETDEAAITEAEPDDGLISATDYLPEEIEASPVSAVGPTYDKNSSVTSVQASEKVPQNQTSLLEEAISSAALPHETTSNEAAPIAAEQTDSTDAQTPSSLAWLRALKMEDMLLLWLLLLLLSGESQDEIDLLLGLLIFAGH